MTVVPLLRLMTLCRFCGPGDWNVGTIEGVAPWQKRARLVLAVVAIGVIAVVAYTLRPREAVAPPQKIERIDPDGDHRDRAAATPSS